MKNDVHTLNIQGGLDYAYDKYQNGSNDSYVVGKTELNYKYKFNQNVEFKQMISYLGSFEDSEKYFYC